MAWKRTLGTETTSALLTLLIVPTAYSLLEGFTDRLGNLFRRKGTDVDVHGDAVPELQPAVSAEPATNGASPTLDSAAVPPVHVNGATEKPQLHLSSE